ncbi:MAG: hypothetical protein V4710_09850 [Verrucomicrobiota bacterium]
MNLTNLTVTIEADGFHIIDNQREIAEGARLRVHYETAGGWSSTEFAFERDPATLLHPFRRSMFVYTGGEPLRLFMEGYETVRQRRRIARHDVREDFSGIDFFSHPPPGSPAWSDDHLPWFLGIELEESRIDPRFLAQPIPEPMPIVHPGPPLFVPPDDNPPLVLDPDPSTPPGELLSESPKPNVYRAPAGETG